MPRQPGLATEAAGALCNLSFDEGTGQCVAAHRREMLDAGAVPRLVALLACRSRPPARRWRCAMGDRRAGVHAILDADGVAGLAALLADARAAAHAAGALWNVLMHRDPAARVEETVLDVLVARPAVAAAGARPRRHGAPRASAGLCRPPPVADGGGAADDDGGGGAGRPRRDARHGDGVGVDEAGSRS